MEVQLLGAEGCSTAYWIGSEGSGTGASGICRRDDCTPTGKVAVKWTEIRERAKEMLETIQASLLEKARKGAWFAYSLCEYLGGVCEDSGWKYGAGSLVWADCLWGGGEEENCSRCYGEEDNGWRSSCIEWFSQNSVFAFQSRGTSWRLQMFLLWTESNGFCSVG